MIDMPVATVPAPIPPAKIVVPPAPGEVITSLATGNTYEKIRALAEAEFRKLAVLRHPNITYVFDAFEFRNTFYIITERCYCPLAQLFSLKDFSGLDASTRSN